MFKKLMKDNCPAILKDMEEGVVRIYDNDANEVLDIENLSDAEKECLESMKGYGMGDVYAVVRKGIYIGENIPMTAFLFKLMKSELGDLEEGEEDEIYADSANSKGVYVYANVLNLDQGFDESGLVGIGQRGKMIFRTV